MQRHAFRVSHLALEMAKQICKATAVPSNCMLDTKSGLFLFLELDCGDLDETQKARA